MARIISMCIKKPDGTTELLTFNLDVKAQYKEYLFRIHELERLESGVKITISCV